MSLLTEKLSNGDGTTAAFTFQFEYLEESDVKVEVGGVLKTQDTHYTFTSLTEITFTSGNIPPSGTGNVRIYRDTDITELQAEFFAGSAIRAQDLNSDFDQNLFRIQELDERVVFNAGDTMTGPLVLDDTTLQIQEGSDTLTIAAPALTADRTVNFTDVSGNIVTTGDSGTVSRAMLADDAINAGKIDANSIDSEHYVDGSIDREHLAADIVDGTKIADDAIALEHMSANSVDSDQYVDGSIDLIHMSANSVDSDQYVDGSIDRVHLAADIINGSKIADAAVDSEHIADGAIDLAHMSANSVDSDQYVDGSIDNAHLAHNSVDSDQYVDRSIDTIHIGLDQVTYAEMQDISTDLRLLGRNNNSDGTITEVQVATGMVVNDAITSDKLADHATDDSARAVNTNHIKDSAVTSAKIADDTIVNADIKSDAAIAGSKINMSLNQLSDVNVGTPGAGQDDQVLAWDNANSEFSLTTVSGGGGGGLSDVVSDSSPQLGGNLDPNGHSIGATHDDLELLSFSETANAVNEFTIANAATNNDPVLSATGDDQNIGITINPKGTGDINLDAATHIDGTLTFDSGHQIITSTELQIVSDDSRIQINKGTNNQPSIDLMVDATRVVRIQTPTTLTNNTSYTLTLPQNDGDASQFLQTNGSGTLSWQTVDTSSSTTSTTTTRIEHLNSTNSFSVAANSNAAMVGPLTVNTNNTITVPSTSLFKIL